MLKKCKEKFITLEIAMLAVDKGYEYLESEYYYCPDVSQEILEHDYARDSMIERSSYKIYPCISLHDLNDWIRDVIKIDLYLDCIGGGRYFYSIYLNDAEDTHIQQYGETSYYESLELGLKEVLKLI